MNQSYLDHLNTVIDTTNNMLHDLDVQLTVVNINRSDAYFVVAVIDDQDEEQMRFALSVDDEPNHGHTYTVAELANDGRPIHETAVSFQTTCPAAVIRGLAYCGW